MAKRELHCDPAMYYTWNAHDPYADLAAAIVLRAVDDYAAILHKLTRQELACAKRRLLTLHKLRLESFFYSPWYSDLTDIPPDTVIAQCRLLAKNRAIDRRVHIPTTAMMLCCKEEAE